MTTPGPPPTRDPAYAVEALLSQSWLLFRKNWIVALPPVIGAVVAVLGIVPLLAAIVYVAVDWGTRAHQVTPAQGWAIGIGVVLAFAVTVAVALYAVAASYGMADAAWSHGSTSLADGWVAFRRRWGALFVSGLGVLGVAFAALILALPTLGLSLFALPLVTLYVVPSAVAGGRGGFAAVGESFSLVRRSLGRSVVVLLVQITISVVLGYIAEFAFLPVMLSTLRPETEPVLQAPPVGVIVAGALVGVLYVVGSVALGGYYAIVLVGFYRWLVSEAAAARVAAEP